MKPKKVNKTEKLDLLIKESEQALREQIRRLRRLPMNQRTHFLRRRLPGGGSCL
jgi:hypothetical protein